MHEQASKRATDMSFHSDLSAEQRDAVAAMLSGTPAFKPAEVAVALELFDAALAGSEDYRFVFAEDAQGLGGYVCFGPTPMTVGTYDLYWLVTHPERQRQGIARGLVAAMERSLTFAGARLIRVETSSQEGYGAARDFYLSAAYDETAVFDDFYRPGDDLIVFTKRLGVTPNLARRSESVDFETVYDIAFAYRDYEMERDFLRTCSKRFGRGEPTRVVEWASGPSRHLQAFADLGDVECVGVDLARSMVELARQRLTSDAIEVLQGDMRNTRIEPPVDLAFTMLSSIHVLSNEDDLRRHLVTCAESLLPGGLYVIEATHPRDLLPGGTAETEWEQREQDVVVKGQFHLDLSRRSGHRVPAILRLEHVKADQRHEFRIDMPWFVPDHETWKSVIDSVQEFELVASLGDLDIGLASDKPTAWRLVLVLKRS
jgi:ribosomal protein S18 acetylase RimI-like enzyme/ubiquinone/menaquinone biosynthesis C-methylase UbiE